MRKVLALLQIFLVVSFVFTVSLSLNSKNVFSQEEQQVCCEKDNSGNFCSYVSASDCTGEGVLKAATSCDQTSFCSGGCCSGVGGFCYSGYAKALCGNQGGKFSKGNCNTVNECKLGCCIIGTQADFITRDRCIEETGKFPDLEVDFRDNVGSEQECLNLAKNTEQGCCVKENSCTYGAKSECNVETKVGGTGFYKDIYCSSEQLRGQCKCSSSNPKLGGNGDLKATTCLPDRDGVYWKDSCGNPEGLVESGLKKFGGVIDSGECDYNQGNICGDSNKDGIHVCESLDCSKNDKISLNLDNYGGHGTDKKEVSFDGVLNGESWCQFDSKEQEQKSNDYSTADRLGRDPVGSRYYRSLCINGQELIEPCKDFREEYCYSNTIDVDFVKKKYTEARCLKNEWQPCTNECNTANPGTMNEHDYKEALKKDQQCCLSANRDCTWVGSKCVPAVSPGFKFWEGEGADVCVRGNLECTATFVCGGWNNIFGTCEKGAEEGGTTAGLAGIGGGGAALYTYGAVGAFGLPAVVSAGLAAGLIALGSKDSGWNIASGSECLSQNYLHAANNYCRSLGDCGADFNYLGSDQGYKVDNKFTLSYSGFSNSNLGNDEIIDYIKSGEGSEDLGKTRSTKGGKEKLSFANNFKDSGGVPGNLTGVPDWETGEDFFDFSLPKAGELTFGGKVKRALWGGDDLREQGFLGSQAGVLSLGAALGLGFSLVPGGASPLLGFGLGLRSSPLGFLVTGIIYNYLIGDVIGAKGLEKLSLNTARETTFNKAAERVLDAEKTLKVAEEKVDKIYADLAEEQAQEGVPGIVAQDELVVANEEINVAAERVLDAEKTLKVAQQNTFANYMTGVSAALWVYTIFQLGDVFFQSVKPETIKTTCQTWQAPNYKIPKDVDPCERCNPDFKEYLDKDGKPREIRALKACSEYRCRSLGSSCELINKGTTDERCVSLNKLDVNSPKITPWKEGFSLDLKSGFKLEEMPLDNKGNTGLKIIDTNKEDGEGIPIYTLFNIGLETDEPSQCKMSFTHGRRYEAIENNFFGGNTYKNFHIQPMVYPASKGGNETAVTLAGGGHYKLNVRCIDAVGNANEKDYVIEFDVSKEPDLTAPNIVGSSLSPPNVQIGNQTTIGNEVYLTYGAEYTDVTLFVNEPSECRYHYNNVEFNLMNTTNKCETTSLNPDAPPFYSCKFIRGVNGIAGIGPAPFGFKSKPGLTQYVYFKCIDHPEANYKDTRNFNKEAYTVILRGSDVLNITSVKPTDTIKTSASLVNVTLEVQTTGGADLNGKSICKYTTEENLKENIVAMTEFLNTESSLHTQPWQPSSGLQKFYVGCYDKAGNLAYGKIEFEVEQDVTPPFLVRVYNDEGFTPPQFTVELNEPGECKDSAEGTFDYGTGGNLMNKLDVDGKVFSSTTSGSNVYYVNCKDAFGNMMNTATIQIAEV